MVELKKQNFEENKKIFNGVKSILCATLGANTQIEHVGSTALPNMIGKDIIDILVVASDYGEFEIFKAKISELGYFPSTKSATEVYQFFASKPTETGAGDIHVHLSIEGTKRCNDFIVLRDYLLNNPQEAKNYARFKACILKHFSSDRGEYRRVKSDYVSKLIDKSNAEFENFYKNH